VAERTVYEAVIGSDQSWRIYLYKRAGISADPYLGSETVTATVWPGGDMPETFAPSLTWEDPDGQPPTLILAVDGDDTAELDAGDYFLQVTIDGSSRTIGRFRLLATPGEGTAHPAYCTYSDMRRRAGAWLDNLLENSDLSGFLLERAEARQWFDHLLQRHNPRPIYRSTTLDHLLPSWWGGGGQGRHDVTLQGWLDDDRLILTTPAGRRIVEANACYALYLACRGQITMEADDVYSRRARSFRSEAENIARGITAEIDTTYTAVDEEADPIVYVGDGVADLLVDLGTAVKLDWR
jgi:hypothetical protein